MSDDYMREELRGAELVFGLVSPLGTPLDPIEEALQESLRLHGYAASPTIRISALLAQRCKVEGGRPEERREALMEEGSRLRDVEGDDCLARLAVAAVHAWRAAQAPSQPCVRTAHIIRSLKHPEEIARLRAVYGNGFFLIGASAPRHRRLQRLIDENYPQAIADRLLDKDRGEQRDCGQQTRETFHLADVYVNADANFAADVERFVDLVMSRPFLPPTKEEHAMFLAYAASLRSADLSRQVGAVVLDARGDVIATGANDVPSAGGGPYWPSRPEFWPDVRSNGGPDYERGFDSNERERDRILGGVIRVLTGATSEADHELVASHRERLEPTGILDLTEFGRAVHAEMAALLACARSGVSPADGTLFCTTFPCHNCAKHIVDAGIKRVVYVEPYEKSKARDLHDDGIVLVDEHKAPLASDDRRVRFEVFVGVGARRFVDLFSLTLGSGRPVRRKQKGASGARVEWTRGNDSAPRLPLDPRSYLEREKAMAGVLDRDPALGQGADGASTVASPQEDVT
jgi:deoxycytidylate deaminase